VDVLLSLFGIFLVLMFIGVPIGYSIGIATVVCFWWFTATPMTIVAHQAVVQTNSFTLMAIPFFILAGNIMGAGGISRRIVNFARVLIGYVTGGVALVATLASVMFGAVSGSAVATTSAIGSFMIPEMEEEGYDKPFGATVCAAAGTMGVVLPPSIPLVIYGVVVNASIGDLFIAGIIPGLLMGVCLMVACYFLCKKKGYTGKGEKPTLKAVWKAFLGAFWALLAPFIILGGIYTGFFTPTEASAVAVFYCFIVGKFIYRELTWKKLYGCLVQAVSITGATTFMIGISGSFALFLAMQHIPQIMATFMLSITDNWFLLLLVMNIFMLIVGMVVDNIPATIILAPIFLPIAVSFGMSPITLGIMITLNKAISFITPPYGITLNMASAVSKVPLEHLFKNAFWFVIALLIPLLLVMYVPQTTMFLVELMNR